MCGAELHALPDTVQRVARALQMHGHATAPLMLQDAARTAQQAADALGVALGQIAKSVIFRRSSGEGDTAVLVVTAGDRRVDEAKVSALACPAGTRLHRADADFVKRQTGYAIGGVPPLAHAHPPVTLVDESLFRFKTVWAAAGHPHSVFELAPEALARYTGAPVCDVVVDVVAP